jgi:Mg-chelatase subunit ChlD
MIFRLVTIILLGLMIVACPAVGPTRPEPRPVQESVSPAKPSNDDLADWSYGAVLEDLPVAHLSQPRPLLPHDGLFIRRNNEFGTKYQTGFKELVEQGELGDHRNIRWDDFIASNSDKIPAPTPGQALSVTHGISRIPSQSKHDDRATHYLEIALKAPASLPDISTAQKPPANYIFVIDTSGSMKGQKLDTVKTAVAKLYQSMRKTDVIGIIQFSDRARTVLKATPIGDITVEEFSELISGLTAKGGTDINTGLSFGIDEISRHANNYSVNQVFLFSDGNPTSGEKNWNKIRQNISKKARDNTKLSLFAFGTDANIRELNALAGVTGGTYTFVTQASDVESTLNEELKRRDKMAAINVQMQIFIEADIDILHLYGHSLVTDPATRAAVLDKVKATAAKAKQDYGVDSGDDLVTKDKGIRIFVPNLSVGETYWVVFELATEKDLESFGNATVQYVDTFARQNRKHNIPFKLQGDIPAALVAEHGTGLWTSEVIFYAIDDLYEGDISTFKTRIENHIQVLEHLSVYSSNLVDDKIVLSKFLSLAENLGKPEVKSDEKEQQVTMQRLNAFGRLRNGFVQP